MPKALERITLGSPDTPKHTSEPHIAAYEFATKWVSGGETVLDLACGTGYGTERLEQAGVNLRGLLINDVNVQSQRYGAGKYSYQYSYKND